MTIIIMTIYNDFNYNITLNTGDITYNDFTYNINKCSMTNVYYLVL